MTNLKKNELRSIFSKNLTNFLDAKGVNRTQMANELQISYTRICDWARGRTYPTQKELEFIAGYFNTSVETLTQEIELQTIENIKENYYNEDDEKEQVRIYDIQNGIICGPEMVSTRYFENKKSVHIMFYVSDDLMSPKYQYNDLVLVEALLDNSNIESGDYLVFLDKENKRLFMHIYDKGDYLIITPLNINNSKGIMPIKVNKNDVKGNYTLFKALTFTRKIQ